MNRTAKIAVGLVLIMAVYLGASKLMDAQDHQRALLERRARHQGEVSQLSQDGQPATVDSQLQYLREMAHAQDPEVRRQAGAMLEAMTDERADEELERAINERNLPVVAGGYRYVTTWRRGSWPPRRRIHVLADAIRQYGDLQSMRELANDRDAEISTAAEAWGNANGYVFVSH